jgi:hypothetical protein
MSDPKEPNIRIASCLPGICPGCGAAEIPEALAHMPCGCQACGTWRCENEHLRALVLEAMRERDENLQLYQSVWRRLQTIEQDLQEARRERDMFEERAWKYDQLCK